MKTGRPKNAWTAQELQTLRETYAQGVTVAMAALPGRSRDAVIGKANTLHLFVVGRNFSHASRKGRSGQQALAQRQAENAAKWQPQPEYIQAADIFQVGYRVANTLGVVHEYAH